MNHTVDVNFVICTLIFPCVGFFLMLTPLTGCGHTHPIPKHAHPHEHDHHHTHQHDHTHDPLEEVSHGELAGTYRLESIARVHQNEGVERPSGLEATGEIRGVLRITLDHKFVITAENNPNWLGWTDLFAWMPASFYYRNLPDSRTLVLFYTDGHRFFNKDPAYALEYKWNGTVLTLTHFALHGRYSADNVTMKWRKL
ncbi:MAG: hypothetical protein OXP71_10145 [Candidatus Poribacteria bacterium]|nr:hypothetical protein [Candidatus Poribacteria bacterium]